VFESNTYGAFYFNEANKKRRGKGAPKRLCVQLAQIFSDKKCRLNNEDKILFKKMETFPKSYCIFILSGV